MAARCYLLGLTPPLQSRTHSSHSGLREAEGLFLPAELLDTVDSGKGHFPQLAYLLCESTRLRWIVPNPGHTDGLVQLRGSQTEEKGECMKGTCKKNGCVDRSGREVMIDTCMKPSKNKPS